MAVLAGAVLLYFLRLRSKAVDRLFILVCFGCASLTVMHPDIATRVANLVGVGRGADLIVYFSLPGLLMMIFLLFARTRELDAKLTTAVREFAIRDARVPGPSDHSGT